MSTSVSPQASCVSDNRYAETSAKVTSERQQIEARIAMALSLLRRAIHDTGWTPSSLAVHTGRSITHVHEMLSGAKNCTLQFLVQLPPDVRSQFNRLCAQSHGYICVKPCEPADAMGHLVAGLMGVMQHGLGKERR